MLGLIHTGQAGTSRQLAQYLEISETVVAQMIDELVRMGYLEEAVMCVEKCGGCASQAACGSERHLRLWSLTDKGRRAATS